MYCKNCGAEIEPDEYCPKCGTKIEDNNLTTASKKSNSIQKETESNKRFDERGFYWWEILLLMIIAIYIGFLIIGIIGSIIGILIVTIISWNKSRGK